MQKNTKALLAGISILALTLAAAGVWALSDPAPKGKAPTEPLPGSKQAITLDAFLAQPEWPDYVRKDLPRFRTALESIARAAKAKGLTFLWRPTGIDTSDFDQTYPREINETLAHPYVRWGRDPKSGRWDAVVVLQGPNPEQRVLAGVSDALGEATLTLSPFGSTEAGLMVSDAYFGDEPCKTFPERLAKRWSEPVDAFCYYMRDSDYIMIYAFHPTYGMGQWVDGIEGEDVDESGEANFISRPDLERADVLGTDGKHTWFRLNSTLRATKREAFEAWKDPARPDVKKQEQADES